jgi:hypothetical protein
LSSEVIENKIMNVHIAHAAEAAAAADSLQLFNEIIANGNRRWLTKEEVLALLVLARDFQFRKLRDPAHIPEIIDGLIFVIFGTEEKDGLNWRP